MPTSRTPLALYHCRSRKCGQGIIGEENWELERCCPWWITRLGKPYGALKNCDAENGCPALSKGGAIQASIFSIAFSNERRTSWERQVTPQIVDVAWRGAGSGIVAFPAEHRNVFRSKRWPDSGAPAGTNDVVHEKRPRRALNISLLVDSAGAFPPGPLPGGVVIFPNVIQESGALRGASAVPPAAEEEEVTVWANPANRAPPRPANICSGRSGLRAIRPGLIGDAGSAAAGDP